MGSGEDTVNRNRAADVTVGYAADPAGTGIAYAAVATGTGQGLVRAPFSAAPLALYAGRELGYAAVVAVLGELRRRGISRLRLRVADADLAHDLAAPRLVPPALGMPYVKARCALNGFTSVRVERAEPRDTADLESRARAELALRTAA
jgi:hypothetical protein